LDKVQSISEVEGDREKERDDEDEELALGFKNGSQASN
jgi:hypothetical protein